MHDAETKWRMQMCSGRLVTLNAMSIKDLSLDEIAHHLFMQCRFGGATKRHYSVLEHSLIVADQLPDDLKLRGLLHDANEAYTGDIIRPVKAHVGTEIRIVALAIQDLIYRSAGLKRYDPPELKEADDKVLYAEHLYLLETCWEESFWEYISPEGTLPPELFHMYPNDRSSMMSIWLNRVKEYAVCEF